MHDVATGEKRTMDLLVMENLFWKQEIDRTFDLKGIGELMHPFRSSDRADLTRSSPSAQRQRERVDHV